jgi:predicted MFS family arabinose efflux permease
MLFFSLFAGPLIDRFSKKKILIITQSLFMFQAAALTVLTLTGLIQYWHMLFISILYGITQTIDMPARQTFIYELVGKEDIMNAVSLNSTIVNIAKIAGPAIAGVLILYLGIGYCFLINALSYVAVIAGIALIKYARPMMQKISKNIFREAADGLRYISGNKILLINAIVFAVVSTFALNNDVIIPVFSQEVLGSGADVYSILLTAAGIGSLVGALFMASRSKYGIRNSLLIYGGAGSALLQVLTILTSSFYLSLIIIAVIGFMNLVFLNTVNSIFQLNSSNEYRTRVMSIYSLLMQGTTPLGNLFAGAVMDRIPGDSGFVACGSVTLILLIPVFIIFRKAVSSIIHHRAIKA